jgi:hypothetical protein
MPECDPNSPESQAQQAKQRAVDKASEQRLFAKFDELKAESQHRAEVSDEYFDNMLSRFDEYHDDFNEQADLSNIFKATHMENVERMMGLSSDHYHSLLAINNNLDNINSSLKNFFSKLNSDNELLMTANRDISHQRNEVMKNLGDNHDNILMQMWESQTQNLVTINDTLIKNAKTNADTMKVVMGNVNKTLPEKSEITQNRREQQQHELLLQGEREKDRSIFLGIHDLLGKLLKQRVERIGGGGGGGGGGLFGGILGALSAGALKFWGWVKKGFFGVFAFLGRSVKTLFGVIRGLGTRTLAFFRLVGGKLVTLFGTVGKFILGGLKTVFGTLGKILLGTLAKVSTMLLTVGGKLLSGLMNPAVLAITAAAIAGKAIANNINKTTEILELARKASADADKQAGSNIKTSRDTANAIIKDIGADRVQRIINFKTGEVSSEEFAKLNTEDRKSLEKLIHLKKLEANFMKGSIKEGMRSATESGNKKAVIDSTRQLVGADIRVNRVRRIEKQFKALDTKTKANEAKVEQERNIKIDFQAEPKSDRFIEKQSKVDETKDKINQEQRKQEIEVIQKKTQEDTRKEHEKEARDKALFESFLKVVENTRAIADKQDVNIITSPDKPSAIIPVSNMARS